MYTVVPFGVIAKAMISNSFTCQAIAWPFARLASASFMYVTYHLVWWQTAAPWFLVTSYGYSFYHNCVLQML